MVTPCFLVGWTPESVAERAASIAFAGSGEYYMELVHGRPAVSNPPGSTSRFNRRNFTGKKAAKKGDYESAIAKGHTAVLLLMEVTGGLHPEALSFLRALAAQDPFWATAAALLALTRAPALATAAAPLALFVFNLFFIFYMFAPFTHVTYVIHV